jgi:hypothetical protein
MRHAITLLFFLSMAAGCATSTAPADAPPPATCPADPPAGGAACDRPLTCNWLRCAAGGQVTAVCDGASWTVSSIPCPVACGSETCADGQLCQQNEGGAVIHLCADDPCGGAPIGECACSVCPSRDACTVHGFTIRCNTCPSGLCP